MLSRFNDFSPMTRLVIVIVLLMVAWLTVRLAFGLLKMLLPIVIIAMVIVLVLWVYEKARKIG